MLRLRDIMTTDVVTVSPRMTLRDAAELLSARHVGGAPVVDGARVVGVLSASDILTFEASTPTVPTDAGADAGADAAEEWDELPGWEVLGEPPASFFGQASGGEAWTELPEGVAESDASAARGWDPLAAHTVAEAMSRRVFALRPTLDVAAAADRMRSAGVHRVLVMEDDALLGLVTTMDLARAVADHRIVDRRLVFDSAAHARDVDDVDVGDEGSEQAARLHAESREEARDDARDSAREAARVADDADDRAQGRADEA